MEDSSFEHSASGSSESEGSPVMCKKTSRKHIRVVKKSGYRSIALSTALKWLDDNYHIVPGSYIARSTVYSQYAGYCKRNSLNPQSAASFGKVVRLKFPDLTTRRLGTRGQSKYHYYGLGLKESSIYYQGHSERKGGITRFTNPSTTSQSVGEETITSVGEQHTVSSKNRALPILELPSFFKDIVLSYDDSLPANKLETFMLMYRSHCQQVYEAVIRGHYQDVKEFLVHFWKGIPSHILAIIDHNAVLNVIMMYDSILYNSLTDALIPPSLTFSPESCPENMIGFSNALTDWLVHLLFHLPECVSDIKLQAAKIFGKSLQQQIKLLHLAKRIRYSILNVDGLTSTALNDLEHIDKMSIHHQIKKIKLKSHSINSQEIIFELFEKLNYLLEKEPGTVEDYFHFIDDMLHKHVFKTCSRSKDISLDSIDDFYDFVLLWNTFVSYIEVEMIITNAKSQEMFGLLFLFLTQYILYIKELIQSELLQKQYKNTLMASKGINDSQDFPCDTSIRPHTTPYYHYNHQTAVEVKKEQPTSLLSDNPYDLLSDVKRERSTSLLSDTPYDILSDVSLPYSPLSIDWSLSTSSSPVDSPFLSDYVSPSMEYNEGIDLLCMTSTDSLPFDDHCVELGTALMEDNGKGFDFHCSFNDILSTDEFNPFSSRNMSDFVNLGIDF